MLIESIVLLPPNCLLNFKILKHCNIIRPVYQVGIMRRQNLFGFYISFDKAFIDFLLSYFFFARFK